MDPFTLIKEIVSSSSFPQGPDLISSLPEGILISILSRLPIRDAVQTTLLSTKWIDQWKSVTRVDVDDFEFYNKVGRNKENVVKFVDFVHGILIHLKSSTIEEFSLKLSNQLYDPYVTTSWISCVLNKKVRSLHIHNIGHAFISSRSLANCRSLLELVLDMICTIRIPPFYSLQYLQVLRLHKVRILKSSPNGSNEIVLDFPSLKVFEARNCVWSNIILQAPMLESFSFMILDRSLSPTEIQDIQGSFFKIYASPLTFSYLGHLLHDFILLDSPSAFKASVVEISIFECNEERIQKSRIGLQMLLRHFHQAECIKLNLSKFLQRPDDHCFANLPIYGRLVHLEVERVGAEILYNILKNSKNLKTLVIKNYFYLDKNILTSVAAPECFQHSLKYVEFKEFRGLLSEFMLAKFVLKNATVLEKMTIIFPHWLLQDSGVGIFEAVKCKILAYPRKSSRVSIEFSIQS